jgi:hypothetical protein
VSPDADIGPRKTCLCRLRQIDDLGDVRQIIAGERDDVGPPAVEKAEIGGVILDLQIDDADRVSGSPHCLSDELQA